MEKIYIFGHKKPDTDSVTSAIALSYLKRIMGYNAVPKVLGRLNNETKYVLKTFNIRPPEFLNDVKMQIKDVNYNKGHINYKASVRDCYDYLKDNELSAVPVTDDSKSLKGIVTLKDISSYLMTGNYIKLNTSYDNIIKVLDAEEILRFDNEITGNIMVASYRSTTFMNNIDLDNNTILIVGDRHSILEYAVNSKVKMIIVIGSGEIKQEHLNIAKDNKVNIIRTDYDTFHTAKLINSSNYLDDIIVTRNPIKFDDGEYLNDFIEIGNEVKHSTFPIVDKNNNCLGFLRLNDVNNKVKKKVILVDHNEYSQTVDGIEEAEIVEVIDHHKLGTLATSLPISFRNMPVGSTNTIIYNMFNEYNINIPYEIAGIMLSGIISDTLLLKSPTTTEYDRNAVEKLCKIVNKDYKEYGIEMFRAGSSLKGKSNEEILFKDFKVFKVGNVEAGIGQIFVMDYATLTIDKEDFVKTLNDVSINNDYSIVCLFITDVMNNCSYILYNDKSKYILEDSFDVKDLTEGYKFDNIVSRKQQIIPSIIDVLERK